MARCLELYQSVIGCRVQGHLTAACIVLTVALEEGILPAFGVHLGLAMVLALPMPGERKRWASVVLLLVKLRSREHPEDVETCGLEGFSHEGEIQLSATLSLALV